MRGPIVSQVSVVGPPSPARGSNSVFEGKLLTPEYVVGVLRELGLWVRSEDVAAIERLNPKMVRVVIARNGAAFQVLVYSDEEGKWRKSLLCLMTPPTPKEVIESHEAY